MILHIPHASRLIPAECRPGFLLSEAEIEREVLRSTDAWTDELFGFPGATRVVFPVSRLVVDPERFVENDAEPMARRGRGVIYTRTTEEKPLRSEPDPQTRRRFLEAWYHPHHRKLMKAVGAGLESTGRALIVDCHSFPVVSWVVEMDGTSARPEFCIGTDAFHTPPELTRRAVDFLKAKGFTVAVDHPYAGSIVPLTYYRKDARVASIMIEVRRDLYMDEVSGARTRQGEEIGGLLSELLEQMDAMV